MFIKFWKYLKELYKKLDAYGDTDYGKSPPSVRDYFDIWKSKDNCPICESKLTNAYEHKYCMYEGNHMRYRLHCKNGCYVKITNDYGPYRQEQDPTWKIFGRDFYVFDDEPRRTNQINELYGALDYWKNGERYLVEIMLEGECKWKK